MPSSCAPTSSTIESILKVKIKDFSPAQFSLAQKAVTSFMNAPDETLNADIEKYLIQKMGTDNWNKGLAATPSLFTYYFPKHPKAINLLTSGLDSNICEIDSRNYVNTVYISFLDKKGNKAKEKASILSWGILPDYIDFYDHDTFWATDEDCLPGDGKIRDLIKELASRGFKYAGPPNECLLADYINIELDKNMLDDSLEKKTLVILVKKIRFNR